MTLSSNHHLPCHCEVGNGTKVIMKVGIFFYIVFCLSSVIPDSHRRKHICHGKWDLKRVLFTRFNSMNDHFLGFCLSLYSSIQDKRQPVSFVHEGKRCTTHSELSMDPRSSSNPHCKMENSGLILGLHPANERQRCFVTPSLIGWTQNLESALKLYISRA